MSFACKKCGRSCTGEVFFFSDSSYCSEKCRLPELSPDLARYCLVVGRPATATSPTPAPAPQAVDSAFDCESPPPASCGASACAGSINPKVSNHVDGGGTPSKDLFDLFGVNTLRAFANRVLKHSECLSRWMLYFVEHRGHHASPRGLPVASTCVFIA